MPRRGRPDDDLVPKDDIPRRRGKNKPPLPPERPPPAWDPLYVENEHIRGCPRLPPHVRGKEPLQVFRLFWDDEMINKIVVYTNCNAQLQRSSGPLQETARSWAPVTNDEIYSYLSIVIHMGLHRESQVGDYWRED